MPDPYLPAVDERLGVVPLARPADDQHEAAELGVGVGGRALQRERRPLAWSSLRARIAQRPRRRGARRGGFRPSTPNLPSFGARVPGGILLPRQWIRRPLFAEPRGRGWYIADAENNEVSCAVYISKRAAVASIRAMPAVTADPPPLFYTVK